MSSGLLLPEKGDCAFCAYLSGGRPYTILRRDALTATLVTREQRGKPHLLIIPIAHRATLLDLQDQEAYALMVAVRDAARLIDRAYKRPGIAVWQNNGVDADQTIRHLHFHVAGTLDEGGTERGKVIELSVEQTDKIAERLCQGEQSLRNDASS
ncbi:HIT family protein [Stenotrophomonas sp. SRS1]|nr:HIT family protein [Stenotrophomonas sp. SRS1]